MRISALVAILLVASLPRLLAEDAKELVRRLCSEDCSEREAAQQGLIDLGDAAVSALQEAAQGDEAEVRERASAALAAIAEGKERRAIADRLRQFARDTPFLRFSFRKSRFVIVLRTRVEQRNGSDVLVCEDKALYGLRGPFVDMRDVLDLSSLTTLELSHDDSVPDQGQGSHEHLDARICEGRLIANEQHGNAAAEHEEIPLCDLPSLISTGYMPLRLAACTEPSAGHETPFLWLMSVSYSKRDLWPWRLVCDGQSPLPGGPASEKLWKYDLERGNEAAFTIWVTPGAGISQIGIGKETVAPETR